VVGGIPDRVVGELYEYGEAFIRPNTHGAGGGVTYDPETLKMVWEQMAARAGPKVHIGVLGPTVPRGTL
jgi:hypothetical protein